MSNSNIRLRDVEVEAIKSSFKDHFLPNDHLWLFGSRADLSKRGGDIDLYIETNLQSSLATEKRLKMIGQICKMIGDQKIDVVLHLLSDDVKLPIYEVARKEGVQIL